jgi:hypothetical protein
MGAKNAPPQRRHWGAASLALAACPVRAARAGGDAKPSAGAVSHRQQVMRIAINTGVLAPSVRQHEARGLVFRISVSKSRLDRNLAGHRQHLAGNLRAR